MDSPTHILHINLHNNNIIVIVGLNLFQICNDDKCQSVGFKNMKYIHYQSKLQSSRLHNKKYVQHKFNIRLTQIFI